MLPAPKPDGRAAAAEMTQETEFVAKRHHAQRCAAGHVSGTPHHVESGEGPRVSLRGQRPAHVHAELLQGGGHDPGPRSARAADNDRRIGRRGQTDHGWYARAGTPCTRVSAATGRTTIAPPATSARSPTVPWSTTPAFMPIVTSWPTWTCPARFAPGMSR